MEKELLRTLTIIMLTCLFVSSSFAQEDQEEEDQTLQAKVYQCREVDVTIDGVSDDEVWSKVPAISLENGLDGYYENLSGTADLSATAKLTWNEEGLYVL